jgi:cytochrome b subunit of formate dehydrogenase
MDYKTKHRFYALISGITVIAVIGLFFGYALPLLASNSNVQTETGFALLPSFNSFIGFTVLVLLLGIGFYFKLKNKK